MLLKLNELLALTVYRKRIERLNKELKEVNLK